MPASQGQLEILFVFHIYALDSLQFLDRNSSASVIVMNGLQWRKIYMPYLLCVMAVSLYGSLVDEVEDGSFDTGEATRLQRVEDDVLLMRLIVLKYCTDPLRFQTVLANRDCLDLGVFVDAYVSAGNAELKNIRQGPAREMPSVRPSEFRSLNPRLPQQNSFTP